MSFSNSYWSADYRLGIHELGLQSTRSLKQLHELRKLVASFLSYNHANSAYLGKLALDLYLFESAFRQQTREKRLSSLRKASGLKEKEPVSLNSTYELFLRGTSNEAQTLADLASAIERNVLEEITDFIKLHEPQVRSILQECEDLFADYDSTYKRVEKLKGEYSDYLRFNEFADTETGPVSEPATPEKTLLSNSPKTTPDSQNLPEKDDDDFGPLLESEFDFPIQLGSLKFTKKSELEEFLRFLISSISTIRRTIPLPGYRNDIFSSDQLCDLLTKKRPHGFNPSRLNLEKLGQGLIDAKLLVGTGIFAKKFRSENMWFEWSPLAFSATESEKLKEPLAPSTPQKTPKVVIDESTKFMNDMATSTSKTFNGLFKSVRSSLRKSNYPEKLLETESKYNDSYLELQELKHLLDIQIFEKSQILQTFEKNKIELVYQSLTKLLEISYNFSLTSSNKFHEVATEFITNINKPENYQRDFEELLNTFSTGIYFPSNVSPESLARKHYSSNQSNSNFQSVKLQFNLYRDIPLQLQLKDSLLSLSSIPIFLFKAIKLIEESESITELWTAPINHQQYWSVKQETIQLINSFQNDVTEDESTVHGAVLEKVIQLLSEKETAEVLNFTKNWLLETSDSLIPCMVFDLLISNYRNSMNAAQETIKILTGIPRSNLASLIFILEHICLVFDLSQIASYEISDNLSEELEQKSDPKNIEAVVQKLNSMEAIGSIPFVHLIFRPSAVKNAAGFKPPIATYNALLCDLLDVGLRGKLFSALVESERNYVSKREHEKSNLGLKKTALPPTQGLTPSTPRVITSDPVSKTVIANGVPKSPRPLSGENFSLRPFRTGTTPRPSPSSSPVQPARTEFSGNELRVKKRESMDGRPRSSSSSFLAPNINVEFER